jgi:hypothetical protein
VIELQKSQPLSGLKKKKDPAAVALRRKGGRKVAKRGSECFRDLQAKRKHRRGGVHPSPRNLLKTSSLEVAA